MRAILLIHYGINWVGRAGKKTALLSIGDEVDEDDDEIEAVGQAVRFRSAHETAHQGGSRLQHVEPGSHDAQVQDLKEQLAFEQVRHSI